MFALERSTLEQQALDARLRLLQAQVEPHFLFNTLANVQELVEPARRRPRRVLRSLIAYLRAAMPRLHDGGTTLAREAGAGARVPRADADAHARPAAIVGGFEPGALRGRAFRRWRC